MLKSEALAHFETVANVARALDISSAAVCRWGCIVPYWSAQELERVTKGKLKLRASLYVRGRPIKGEQFERWIARRQRRFDGTAAVEQPGIVVS